MGAGNSSIENSGEQVKKEIESLDYSFEKCDNIDSMCKITCKAIELYYTIIYGKLHLTHRHMNLHTQLHQNIQNYISKIDSICDNITEENVNELDNFHHLELTFYSDLRTFDEIIENIEKMPISPYSVIELLFECYDRYWLDIPKYKESIIQIINSCLDKIESHDEINYRKITLYKTRIEQIQ